MNNQVLVRVNCTTYDVSQITFFKDCKWKMFMELDGDDVAVAYIKDVIFNANRQDVELLRMTKVTSETHFLHKYLIL